MAVPDQNTAMRKARAPFARSCLESEATTMPAMSSVDEIDFEAEAQLDRTIQFPHALSQHALTPTSVFLTGATGFLGAYLLDELLHQTEATVYCLVRASDADTAKQRLVGHLQAYDLWHQALASRIRPVVGDLTQPYLGLSAEQFLHLATQVDVIYHSAGWINTVFPYARLKPTNVVGTQEVLRLAGLVATKPVHFMSTLAVLFSEAHADVEVLKESDTPHYHPSLKSGYSKSKWVADRLVAQAQARGLPTCIYRPVRIMGHSRTGAINDMNDILPLVLKGCILLGKYPAFDIDVTLVPVDYVSRAMVHLASQEKSWGRAFHFFHPAPLAWHRLMASLRALGYPLEEVAYDQWWQEIKQRTRQNMAQPAEHKSFFATLLLALIAPHYLLYKRPLLDASYTQEGLAGTDIVCPPFDHALLATYVAYWQKSGYLPMPSEQPTPS